MSKLNIICGNSGERLRPLMAEIVRLGIDDYEMWEGKIFPHSVKESINASHRMIVQYAKDNYLPEVTIAEDDFVGCHENSWRYYQSRKPKNVYDVFLSMVYTGNVDEDNFVSNFTGFTLYTVHARFYDKFLSASPLEHIDKEISAMNGIYKVCNPFAFIQRDGFVSSNTGKAEWYDTLLAGRALYDGS